MLIKSEINLKNFFHRFKWAWRSSKMHKIAIEHWENWTKCKICSVEGDIRKSHQVSKKSKELLAKHNLIVSRRWMPGKLFNLGYCKSKKVNSFHENKQEKVPSRNKLFINKTEREKFKFTFKPLEQVSSMFEKIFQWLFLHEEVESQENMIARNNKLSQTVIARNE